MISEVRIGAVSGSDGTTQTARAGKTGESIVAQAHGKYFEAASRQKLFFAANQSAVTWSVALNTTHTGLVISNPASSGKLLILKQASVALSVAPAGIAHFGLFAGFAAAGVVTHTTPLTIYSTYIGGSGASAMKADAAATLVGTPVWVMPVMGGFTAGALHGTSPSVIDIDGSIVVPAGGYVGIGALTVAVGFAGMVWEEVDA